MIEFKNCLQDTKTEEITMLKNGSALFPIEHSYMPVAPLGVKDHSALCQVNAPRSKKKKSYYSTIKQS